MNVIGRRFLPMILMILCPGFASAAGLELAWNNCPTAAGSSSSVIFDCSASGPGQYVLYARFTSPVTISNVVGIKGTLKVTTAPATLPDFWHMESGGCNAGDWGLFISATGCGTSWPFQTFWSEDYFVTSQPNQARFRYLITTPQPITLGAANSHFAFNIDIGTPGGTCSGCMTPVCIEWDSTAINLQDGTQYILTGSGPFGDAVSIDAGCATTSVGSFTPMYGATGARVAVTGTGFTGASAVQFNGSNATFTVNSDNSIAATVPSGATAGPIQVINSPGMGASSTFFYPCVPDPSLVAWWPGDVDATDVTGHHNGTLQNGTTFASGRVGMAFSFNGAYPSGGYVSVLNDPAFNVSNKLTLEAWIKPTDGASRYIMTKGEDSFFLAVGGNYAAGNQLSLYLNGVSGGWLYGTSDLVTDGKWHHVAATYDGATIALYVDGRLENSFARSGTVPAGTSPIAIGARPGVNYFAGLMDEIAIYNRALTATEIKATSDAAPSGRCGAGQPVAVDEPPSHVTSLDFAAPYPNPTHGATNLEFQLPVAAVAQVEVVDVAGRRVTSLLRGEFLSAGIHRVAWDGLDAEGRRAAAGIYEIRVVAGVSEASRRVVLIN
jgi:hypothetical protein